MCNRTILEGNQKGQKAQNQKKPKNQNQSQQQANRGQQQFQNSMTQEHYQQYQQPPHFNMPPSYEASLQSRYQPQFIQNRGMNYQHGGAMNRGRGYGRGGYPRGNSGRGNRRTKSTERKETNLETSKQLESNIDIKIVSNEKES